MNKSDFISDAVALDLGKSGVKVAETLEININNEWWNFINSSEQMSLSVYNKREKAPPLITGDIMDISGMNKIRVAENNTPKTTRNPMFTAIFANGDTVVLNGSTVKPNTVTNPTYFEDRTLQILNMNSQTTSAVTLAIRKGDPWLPVYYDPIVNAICCCYRYYFMSSYRWYVVQINSNGQVISNTYVSTSAAYSANYFMTYCLPEAPQKVYAIFWTSGGAMSVKSITHAVDDNQSIKTRNLVSSSGATALSAVPTTALYSAGAYMFYLRQAESIGIAFLDSVDSRIKYVLESENWEVLHTLNDIGSGNTQLNGFGTMTTPLDGEFFMAHFKGQEFGNLGKPSGYTFPTNMVIQGFTRIGEKKFRMFGTVASTLYVYTLDPDTMTLAYEGVASTEWTVASGSLPIFLTSSGDLELYVWYRRKDPYLMLYNAGTNEVVWTWISWNNTNFPTTGLQDSYDKNYTGIWYTANKSLVFFCRVYAKYMGTSSIYMDVVTINPSDLFLCISTAEVNLLFTPDRRMSMSQVKPLPTVLYHDHAPTFPIDGVLTPIENENAYIFTFFKYNRRSTAYPVDGMYFQMGIDKRTLASGNLLLAGTLFTREGNLSISVQNQKARNEYDLDMTVDSADKDGLTRFTDGSGIRFATAGGSAVSSAIASTGTTADASGVNIPVVCNEKDVAFFISYVTNAQSTLRCSGAFLQGTPSGQTDSFDVPFIIKNAGIDSWNNISFFTGAIVDGEIPYVKLGAKTWTTKYVRAISVKDGAIYDVDAGNPVTGGIRYFYPCGSTLFWMSNTGYVEARSTGATWTAGMGEEVAMEDAPSATFHYKENNYIPYPFAREGIKVELSNISKMTKITLPETQTDLIRTMLASGTDFRGSRCVLRRVFPDHVEEGSDIVLLDGYIQDWSYSPDKKGILFTVSKTLIDVGSPFPKRLMNMGCSHVFKGVRCGYLGEDGICTKTKTDCTSKGAVTRFGGFPWVAARQRRVMWR
ncbi:MAG: hypothetical protein AGIKBDMD_00349 [Synergistaceae bacterium]